ncbi:MAG: alpha/beta hydrolase [Bacteroidota bacterium]
MKKQLVRILSTISPSLVTELAYRTLTNPRIKKLREHELELLDKAQQKKIKFGEFDIQTYAWGEEGNEKILLIHGWEGQAGNFTDIIRVLLKNNYYVIAFDGPSHGFSSKGKTSLFEFSDLVAKMIQETKCRNLISHSFGGVATTYALSRNQDVEIDKYVLLTTPDKFRERIEDVARYVGVTDKVKNKLIERLESEIEMEVAEANVSLFVKDIKVNKALIIHDKNDKIIPIAQSRNVCANWEACEFTEVEGTGHFRILRTDEVIETVAEFMNQKNQQNGH